MNAVDTNVLLYVHDPRDVTKQVTASNLLMTSRIERHWCDDWARWPRKLLWGGR